MVKCPKAIRVLDPIQNNNLSLCFDTNIEQLPTSIAMQKTKQLLDCGVRLGELDPNYLLLAGRQIYATESPGLELYGEIQDWEHWSSTP